MTTDDRTSRAALIVCGGQSRRMGEAKAYLPFGEETMLERIVRIVWPMVQEVVLLIGKTQEPPPLAWDVEYLPDRVEGQGPAAAICDGFKLVFPWADATLVLSCDLPLVSRQAVDYLFDEIGSQEACMPRQEGIPQPLAAVYHPGAWEKFDRVLATGNQRLLSCIEGLDTHWIGPRELATIDPLGGLFRNVNTPEDYNEALRVAGLDS